MSKKIKLEVADRTISKKLKEIKNQQLHMCSELKMLNSRVSEVSQMLQEGIKTMSEFIEVDDGVEDEDVDDGVEDVDESLDLEPENAGDRNNFLPFPYDVIHEKYACLSREKLSNYQFRDRGITDFGGYNATFGYKWEDFSVSVECYPNKKEPFIFATSASLTTESKKVFSLNISLDTPEWAIPGIFLIKNHYALYPIRVVMFMDYHKSLQTTKYTVEQAREVVEHLKRFVPEWFSTGEVKKIE